ncbi:TetR/AcrR family transcriptional regulator [Antrihabitans cavernicola]|uniref:TetR/AcrR family transcriptional regulator n=1 Tax=Antrihabitans cavernicola TaxID=2495913 RepID=A0A5A7SIY5_9NOCA|nr:TetR/AcrR family transcriptional regulator [Spelaeibacter cavernicola]KAA0024201.1 TetR/AcrR family transcriptional regulator [Spelaeibacter cavernicola]
MSTSRSYGGRLVVDRKAERRSRFLDAGLEIFSGKGYAKSSITDICAAAGLSRRQFYEEFGSREDLLFAVYDWIQLDAREAVTAAVLGEPSRELRRVAAAAMSAYVRSVGTDPRRAEVSFVQIIGVSDHMEQHRIDGREQWTEFFHSIAATIVGPSYVPPGGYTLAATAFIAALTALVHRWSVTTPRPPVDDVVEPMTVILVALLSQSG